MSKGGFQTALLLLFCLYVHETAEQNCISKNTLMAHVGTAVVTFVQKWAQRTGVSDWKMSTLTYRPHEHPNSR